MVTNQQRPFAYYLGNDNKLTPITSKGLFSAEQYGGYHGDILRDDENGYARAVIVSAWARNCVEMLAQKVSEIMRDAQVVDKRSGKVIENHPLKLGLEKTRREYRQDIFYEWEYNRKTYGENYIELVSAYPMPGYTMFGIPSCLRSVNPLAIEPYVNIFEGTIPYFVYEGKRLKSDCIVFDKTKNPVDDYRGLSPMATALDAVNVDMHIQRFTNSFYQNSAKPGIVFSIKTGATVTDTLWNRMLATIREQMMGVRNAFRPMMLDMPFDATVLPTPDLADQGLTVDQQKERIAAVFRVPVPLITFGDAKYQLSPEQRKSLYEETLIPECQHIAEIVDIEILPFFDPSGNARFELDLDKVHALIKDQQTENTMIKDRYHGGLITFNQMQEAQKLPVVDGGDFYLIPSGLQPMSIEQLRQLTTPKPAPALPALPASTPVQSSEPITVERDPLEQAIYNAREGGRIQDGKHATPEDELSAWRKAALNSNKGLRFVAYRVPQSIADSVRTGLQDAAEPDAIKAVFAGAFEKLAIKAIAATRLDFEGAFDTLLNAGRSSEIDRRTFSNRLRTLLRVYARKAYVDGLTDGGIEDGELDSDDESELSSYIASQSQYISAISAVLYKEDGVTDAQADVKAAMWFNKSIEPAYHKGLLSADKNGVYEWVYGDTEHCEDCNAMNGQKHRLKDFAKRGILPKAGILACNGFNCECNLVRSSGRMRGAWL
jgi:HK97 family phage portal protein